MNKCEPDNFELQSEGAVLLMKDDNKSMSQRTVILVGRTRKILRLHPCSESTPDGSRGHMGHRVLGRVKLLLPKNSYIRNHHHLSPQSLHTLSRWTRPSHLTIPIITKNVGTAIRANHLRFTPREWPGSNYRIHPLQVTRPMFSIITSSRARNKSQDGTPNLSTWA